MHLNIIEKNYYQISLLDRYALLMLAEQEMINLFLPDEIFTSWSSWKIMSEFFLSNMRGTAARISLSHTAHRKSIIAHFIRYFAY